MKEQPVFEFSTEIFFDELDALGVLHHPRYFHHLERAQQAFFQVVLGVDDFNAERDEDIYVVVHGLECRFRQPIRHPRHYRIAYTVERIRAGGLTMGFRFTSADGEILYCDGRRTVCKLSGQTHQPTVWTPAFRQALENWSSPMVALSGVKG